MRRTMRNPEVDEGLAAGAQATHRVSSSTLSQPQSRWLIRLAWAAPRSVLVAIAAPVMSGLLLLFQAWLLARILDMAISHDADIVQLLPMMMGVVTLIAVRAFILWAGERAASWGAGHIKAELRQTLFACMVYSGPQWTSAKVSGELASALIDQVEALDGYFARYLPSAVAAGFLPLVFGLVLLPVDWVVGLLLLVSAPLIPLFMMLVGWGAEAASRDHQRALSRLSGLFADRLRGAFTLRLFSRSRDEIDTVRRASHDLSRRTMAVLRIAFLSSAVLEFFAALGVAGVAVYIGLSYLGMLGEAQNAMSLQTGLLCLLLAPEVYNPLRRLAASYHDRAAARAAVGQLDDLFGALPSVPATCDRGIKMHPVVQTDQGINAGKRPAVLELHDLTVCLSASSKPVLENVSMALAPGQHAALVGISGTGKTTLLEAICGWRDISRGQVSYRGVLLEQGGTLTVDDGVVLISQRPFFAPATIAENLRVAAPGASDDALWRALRQACADEFVRALPDTLSTLLGVGGYGLSGGQRHRLALARLFLTDPALILLDEPTAHLDGQTRDAVMTSLRTFATGRAMMVATHDPVIAAGLDVVWHIQGTRVATP